ncbi:MAG TPA: hypothetical protein PLV92_02405, partial [Pirellulaceae bacterium]|nr:hypothetical protein [Pirellulaceae bacterium]
VGGPISTGLNTAYQTPSYLVRDNGDGILRITVSDNGGSDVNWAWLGVDVWGVLMFAPTVAPLSPLAPLNSASGSETNSVISTTPATTSESESQADFNAAMVSDVGPAPSSLPLVEQIEPPVAALDDVTLNAVLAAAVRRWNSVGLTSSQQLQLAGAKARVADLSDRGYLGFTTDTAILIDASAAGLGWFVDSTPLDDREFPIASGSSQWIATVGTPAASRVDLLTVVMHELGHWLGLDDDSPDAATNELMDGRLDVGHRRLPSSGGAPLVDLSRLGDSRLDDSPRNVVTLGDMTRRPISADIVFSRYSDAVVSSEPLTAGLRDACLGRTRRLHVQDLALDDLFGDR